MSLKHLKKLIGESEKGHKDFKSLLGNKKQFEGARKKIANKMHAKDQVDLDTHNEKKNRGYGKRASY
jgi:hypothetical protein